MSRRAAAPDRLEAFLDELLAAASTDALRARVRAASDDAAELRRAAETAALDGRAQEMRERKAYATGYERGVADGFGECSRLMERMPRGGRAAGGRG